MNTKLIHLLENYEQNKGNETFKEWCELESQSDPNFFRWLFDDENLQDFSCAGHEDEWQDFLGKLDVIGIQHALNCELSEKAYSRLIDAYYGDIDNLLNDIEHDYLTANDYQERTYLHYLDENSEWLIDVETGEHISDEIDCRNIVDGVRYYITMRTGDSYGSQTYVSSIADADNDGFTDLYPEMEFSSLDDAREMLAGLRAHAIEKGWVNVTFTLWSTAEQSPINC